MLEFSCNDGLILADGILGRAFNILGSAIATESGRLPFYYS